ncbi:MAG TPA: hypothetical protein VNA15_08020 [Candidatus Angelobacter sp.]|nr:hypothetical protein [Candidatus Angelobacter sp.]
MTSTLPRVNFLGVIAGVLALVSIILPWWGITATGFSSATSSMWGFFGAPSHNPDVNTSSFSDTITTYSPIILALVLLTTALAIAGSFTTRVRVLAGGLAASATALVGYSELIGYSLSSSCQGAGCITSLTGSESIGVITLNWGFQLGFYFFLATTILLVIGLAFHQTLTRRSKEAASNQKA